MPSPRPLSPDFIEILLNMHESETLDFKREQYPFEKAGNDKKGELIKDILAFANAWKTDDAYILIGVEEVSGGRAKVLGIDDHIDDAKIQQLVNSKTNRPVKFSYIAINIDGKSIGVLCIDKEQNKPLCLKKDYGKLKADAVYIRHGSSTDEAKTEEIARMGRASFELDVTKPIVQLGVGDYSERSKCASSMKVTPKILIDPPRCSFEDSIKILKTFEHLNYSDRLNEINPIRRIPINDRFNVKPTPEEMRKYHQEIALLVPIGLYIENTSGVVAQDVRVEINIPINSDIDIVEEGDHPKHRPPSIFPHFHSAVIFSRDLSLMKSVDRIFLEATFGKVQPQAESWLGDLFYLKSSNNIELEMLARIFADNLPEPIQTSLKINVYPEEIVYDPDEWEN